MCVSVCVRVSCFNLLSGISVAFVLFETWAIYYCQSLIGIRKQFLCIFGCCSSDLILVSRVHRGCQCKEFNATSTTYTLNTLRAKGAKSKEQFSVASFHCSFNFIRLFIALQRYAGTYLFSKTFEHGTTAWVNPTIYRSIIFKKERAAKYFGYLQRIAWFGLMSLTIKVICETNHRLILQSRITRFWTDKANGIGIRR